MNEFIHWWTQDRLSLLFAGIAAFAALFAWLSTVRANRIAREANKMAEKANELAKESLTKARDANSIANDANQISGDANSISRRALAVAEDRAEYFWVFEADRERRKFLVRNNCAHFASNVSVFIRVNNAAVGDFTFDKAPPFEHLIFEAPRLFEQLDKRERDWIDAMDHGVFGTPHLNAHIHVTWDSETGAKRSSVIQKELG